jgi:hypothetical protein
VTNGGDGGSQSRPARWLGKRAPALQRVKDGAKPVDIYPPIKSHDVEVVGELEWKEEALNGEACSNLTFVIHCSVDRGERWEGPRAVT